MYLILFCSHKSQKGLKLPCNIAVNKTLDSEILRLNSLLENYMGSRIFFELQERL